MAGNFKVGMTLTAKDEASQVLEKGQKQVIKATEGVTKATRKAGAEQKRTEQESINSTKKAAKRYSVPPVPGNARYSCRA